MVTDISLQERLRLLREMVGEEGPAAAELRELEEKLEGQQFMVGFCGHFSAGKSSLINTLCGKTIMPTGPLPTSANVVLIREGASRALLTPAVSGEPCLEVPLEDVADYCRDGQAYTRVELWEELELPLHGGALLDTPGVDSNDAGHALATYSALHLADVVFYVMDYNHVSSETNLSFAQSLMDYGKPLYMVVNQIDKHREEELPWSKFQDSAAQSFDIWNIKPQGIFYISLKHPETPGNMLNGLTETIAALLSRGPDLIEYGIFASAERTVQAHLERLQNAGQEEHQRLEEATGGEVDAQALENELRDLEERGESVAGDVEAWKRDGLDRISKIADTVQLMTPPLRELAGRYLESQAPGFKAKGWFSGGRTEAEKAERREGFLLALSEQVQAGLDWHIRQELRRIGQELEIWSEAWEGQLDEAMPRPEAEWIKEPLPAGALLSAKRRCITRPRYPPGSERVTGGPQRACWMRCWPCLRRAVPQMRRRCSPAAPSWRSACPRPAPWLRWTRPPASALRALPRSLARGCPSPPGCCPR
ncbi:dynamin family protein [Paenibacillus sanguinis]|uniref:dynamin family protein n=1 Tax=Paenibacillus sanguinis TaxID=225906 RepID=UPI0003A39536|nr:dynamin family protein [Paenibacillus sanguinis]